MALLDVVSFSRPRELALRTWFMMPAGVPARAACLQAAYLLVMCHYYRGIFITGRQRL